MQNKNSHIQLHVVRSLHFSAIRIHASPPLPVSTRLVKGNNFSCPLPIFRAQTTPLPGLLRIGSPCGAQLQLPLFMVAALNQLHCHLPLHVGDYGVFVLHTKFSKYCGKALGWYFVHWPFKKLEASTFTTLSPPLASWVKAEEPDSDDDVGAKDLYDEPVHMREIGDRDGFGKFCIGIDGVDVTDGGPTTKDQIHEIVREAIMESRGDEWTTQDFLRRLPRDKCRQGQPPPTDV